jgi:4-cresol dehydrogenase (hydroxylating)
VATPNLARAIEEFTRIVGAENVMVDEAQTIEFSDPFATIADRDALKAPAVVQPATVEEIQAILRVANELKQPVWFNSQGRNNGYGGSATRQPGSIVINLRRMKNIEVNLEHGYAVVEPGVNFFELHDAVNEASNGAYWMDPPDLGWGSVLGNALEYGVGYTPYGDHGKNLRGLEVVLPTGELIRTGFGAMPGNNTWHLANHGYGPSIEGLFFQSNFGVVTKGGVWLMPAPEVYAPLWIRIFDDAKFEALIDTLRPFMQDRTITNLPVVWNALARLGLYKGRDELYDQPGVIPDEVVWQMGKSEGIGAWNIRCALYGTEAVVDDGIARITAAFEAIGAVVEAQKFNGPPPKTEEQSITVQAGMPSLDLVESISFDGGSTGGHLSLGPVAPLAGKDARALSDLMKKAYHRRGYDYTSGMIVNERTILAVSLMFYDTADEERVRGGHECLAELIDDAGKMGFAEYRSHLNFMDQIADQMDFNDGALYKLLTQLKDTLDPNGILSAGKQGIWPKGERN